MILHTQLLMSKTVVYRITHMANYHNYSIDHRSWLVMKSIANVISLMRKLTGGIAKTGSNHIVEGRQI